jgi:hypothetical protein
MDQIDPTSRQRLIRNIFVLVAQFLADRKERFVARQHATTSLIERRHAPAQTSDISGWQDVAIPATVAAS